MLDASGNSSLTLKSSDSSLNSTDRLLVNGTAVNATKVDHDSKTADEMSEDVVKRSALSKINETVVGNATRMLDDLVANGGNITNQDGTEPVDEKQLEEDMMGNDDISKPCDSLDSESTCSLKDSEATCLEESDPMCNEDVSDKTIDDL